MIAPIHHNLNNYQDTTTEQSLIINILIEHVANLEGKCDWNCKTVADLGMGQGGALWNIPCTSAVHDVSYVIPHASCFE